MRVVRWSAAALMLIFGVITLDFFSWKWVVMGLTLYALPMVGQFLPNAQLRIWSLWLGAFLILQALVSPLVFDIDFVSLTPNLDTVVDVKGGLPGIDGKQHVSTDAYGFRTTRNVNYAAGDTYRIFAIGGSTTEQIYLDDRKTWTHLLQENLAALKGSTVEVINTGVAGLRSPHHVATLKKTLAYQPDMIVFLMGINDWNRHIKQNFASQKESWLTTWKPRRQLFLRNSMLGKAVAGIANRLSADKVEKREAREDYGEYYTKQRGSLGRGDKREFLPEEVDAEFADSLQKIGEICHQFEVKCVLLSQPSGYSSEAEADFRAGFWMTPPNEDYALTFESMVHIASLYNNYQLRFAAGNGLEFCDLANNVAPGFEVFYDDCHFNLAGARRVADLLATCVAPLID